MQPGTRPWNPLIWVLTIATVAVFSGGCGTSTDSTAKTEQSTATPAESPVTEQASDTSRNSPALPPMDAAPMETPAKPTDEMSPQEGNTSGDTSAVVATPEEDTQPESEPDLKPAKTLPPTASKSNDPDSSEPSITEPVDPSIVPSNSPVPQSMPIVAMSDAHANTCLVKIGDQFPAVSLNNPFDQPTELTSLLGDKLTVVLLWNNDSPYAIAQLRDLQTDVQRQFGTSEVAVVGINIGDSADTVRDITAGANVTYTQLLDTDGSFYHQVATRCIPRIYLLDSQGQVIWLDLENTVATARHLSQAIAYQLAN